MSKNPKPWAVLAYTVADDKSTGSAIDGAVQRELKSLCDAADFDQLSVAAQVDFKGSTGAYRGVLTTAPDLPFGFEDVPAAEHPLWRSIEAKLKRSTLRVLKEREELNAARSQVLKSFLRFGQQHSPAERYVVFFYGHSYGPMGLFFDSNDDESAPRTLELTALADSLEAIEGRAAVVVFRDCLMNTLETAFQLKDVAEYMIATQSLAPIAGVWPWDTFLTSLMPSAPSGEVAKAIAQQLVRFLELPENREPFADVPYSVIDLQSADAIAEPLAALVTALETARGDPAREPRCAGALEGARVGHPDTPTRPGDPALLDVPTLCQLLGELEGDPAAAPARGLGEVVRTHLVKWHRSRRDVHRGISLYYKPRGADRTRSHIFDAEVESRDDARYRKLALSQATGWDRIALAPLEI